MDYLIQNNVEYSQILFTYCSEFDVPLCYASSAATYGAGEFGYNDDHESISKLMPLNGYGYSKHLVDEWALIQQRKPSNWFGVKFFNVYGPQEEHKGSQRSVVSQAFKQINESGEVKLFKSHVPEYKDGEQLRDFVYVKDIVNAMIALTESGDSVESGIYNLGTGVARSFKDLVIATFKAMGKTEKINYVDMPESMRDQYQYYTQANMDKFNRAIPDFKFHSLEDGIEDYVKNNLAQKSQFLTSRNS